MRLLLQAICEDENLYRNPRWVKFSCESIGNICSNQQLLKLNLQLRLDVGTLLGRTIDCRKVCSKKPKSGSPYVNLGFLLVDFEA